MRLDARQQERYARHLLLDGLGGEGQERLLAAAVRVRGSGDAALWCARYLAASGVGRLEVEVASWTEELKALGPWLALGGGSEESAPAGEEPAPLVEISPRQGSCPSECAMNGARAAIEVVRSVAQGASP